jgi:flagellar biosynthesis/type III secretory pathway chaperone
VDPAHCRESLDQLLTDEIRSLGQLQALLAQEHELLVKNDIEGLERAGTNRQRCVASLVQIEMERRSMCRALGHPEDHKGLESLLFWCDSGGDLKRRWAECAQLATACREQNDRNGMLVNARLKRIETMLGALGGSREPRLYSSQGATPLRRAGGTLATHA